MAEKSVCSVRSYLVIILRLIRSEISSLLRFREDYTYYASAEGIVEIFMEADFSICLRVGTGCFLGKVLVEIT